MPSGEPSEWTTRERLIYELERLVPPDLGEQRRRDEAEEARFQSHMDAGDPLVLVLKGHLWTEARLVRLVERRLERPDQLEISRLTFHQKVNLAVALGALPTEARLPIGGLNKMRNRLAHNLDAVVTPADERELLRLARESSPWLDASLQVLPAGPFPAQLVGVLAAMFGALGRAYEASLEAQAANVEGFRQMIEAVLDDPFST